MIVGVATAKLIQYCIKGLAINCCCGDSLFSRSCGGSINGKMLGTGVFFEIVVVDVKGKFSSKHDDDLSLLKSITNNDLSSP
uniref:Uncharacterized protein n=1 Tax=Romanomermis culicivorax TaxID=13658 RepID=A0A915IQT5_ROMCU